jgi:DNA-binding NarL/FixJ family response regulator
VGSGLLIVDDNRSFAEVARLLLERGGERVVGIAGTSAEAMALAAQLQPQIVLVDMALGEECGVDLARRLAADCSGSAPVIILTSAYSPADIAELVAASPVAGFLPKSDLSVDAIHRIVLSSGRSQVRIQLAGKNP